MPADVVRIPAAHDADGGHVPLGAVDGVALFAGLAPEQRSRLARLATIVQVDAGERVVAEGTNPGAVFVVVAGDVEVARHVEGETAEHHEIRRLGAGETFGELGLLEDLPASASVYAVTATTLLAVPLAEVRSLLAHDPGFNPLFRSVAMLLNARLRSLTDVTVRGLEREVRALQARVTLATLLVATIAVLTGYTYMLGLEVQLAHSGWTRPVVLAISVLGFASICVVMRRSGLPPAFWGFTTHRWWPAVRDALWSSAAVLVLLLGTKWLLITRAPAWRDVPLIYLSTLLGPGNEAALHAHVIQIATYVVIVVPLQEIIVRGCVQGTLQEFLNGRHRALWAIVASNLIFSVTHSYMSPQFALLTLIPGLLWGWLYYRERTLIGPILCHALVGVIAMDVIGLFELYR